MIPTILCLFLPAFPPLSGAPTLGKIKGLVRTVIGLSQSALNSTGQIAGRASAGAASNLRDPMTQILEPARAVDVIVETDVLVVGSGPGGLAAWLPPWFWRRHASGWRSLEPCAALAWTRPSDHDGDLC